VFTHMETWTEIRRRVLTGEISKRQACREYDIHWQTLQKILRQTEPAPFRLRRPRPRPKLDPFLPTIHQILDADRSMPPKQRHTAERIYQRLRDEFGYTGGRTVVRSAVAEWRQSQAEVFVPLAHRLAPTGEEQGVLAGAAPGVEDRPGDAVGHGEDRPLRPADLPPGLPGVKALEAAAVVDGHGPPPASFRVE
jgi:hypothetical protein